MAFIEYNVSEAVGATEHSLTTDTAGPDTQTDEGSMQVQLDLSDMVTGDELKIRFYEKVSSGGSQLLYLPPITLTGPQSSVYLSPAIFVKHGWDVTAQTIAGTSITVNGSIRVAPV